MTAQKALERPLGITVIAAIQFLAAGVSFYRILLFILQLLIQSAVPRTVGVLGPVSLVSAIAYGATGYGLLELKPWSWTAGLLLAVLAIVASLLAWLVALFDSEIPAITISSIRIVVNVVIALYLLQPRVRTLFKNPAEAAKLGAEEGI